MKKYKVVYVSSTCKDVNYFNTIKEVKRHLNCIFKEGRIIYAF